MIKILTDQNFNGKILRVLIVRIPELDYVRTQDIEMQRFTDNQLLNWAAEQYRIILTHDEKTFPIFANEKMAKAKK